MKKNKTHEEYVEELKIKNPTVEVVEKYAGSNIKILHHCLKHDVYWKILPGNALKGKGCKICGKEKRYITNAKTHNQYIDELKNISPYIKVLDEYKGANIPILHRCMIHNIEWLARPSNILAGQGCKLCGRDKRLYKFRKPHSKYVTELHLKNPNVVVQEDYINARTPILHKCLKHNIVWNISPDSALKGYGCYECHKEKIAEKLVKSQEKYIEEVFEANPHIEVIGQYKNAKIPLMHRCKIHNVEWMAYPESILHGSGCYMCGNDKIANAHSMTHEEYVNRLLQVNPSVQVIGSYKNIVTPILHKCVIHDYAWKTSPSSVLQGCGCPKCKTERFRYKVNKTHDEYVQELKIKNPNILVIGNYINNQTPILHKCLLDGYEWNVRPGNLLQGKGCPKCNESKMERETALWLDHNSISYERYMKFDGCVDKRQLSYDFYLPDYNLNIECQGIQHYEPVDYFGGEEAFKIQQKHDAIKRKYCVDHNIELLEIPYWENVENTLNNFLFN